MSIVVLLVLLAAGCRRAVTEVVVRIDSDMPSGPTGLTAVQVSVQRGGTLLQEVEYQLCPLGRNQLPGDIGFVALDSNDTSPLVFSIAAVRAGTVLFRRVVPVTPMLGRTVAIDVFLAQRCTAVTSACPAGQSCGALACEQPQASLLSDDAARSQPVDAGPCPEDASAGIDASLDAGIDANAETGTSG